MFAPPRSDRRAGLSSRIVLGALIALVASAPRAGAAASMPAPSWGTDGDVDAVVRVGHRVYIGGAFGYVGPNTGAAVPLSLNDGSRRRPFARVLGTVVALARDGAGGYYVGGDLSSAGRRVRHDLAHVLPDGRVDPAFHPNIDGPVRALAVSGSTVYVAGDFTRIDGIDRAGLAALDARTGAPTAWDPLHQSGGASVLAVRGDTVYVAGSFSQIGGADRSGLAALDARTGRATDWDPRLEGFVYALRLSGPTLYVGGSFRRIGGQRRHGLAALSVVSGDATPWDPHVVGGPVDALAVSGDDVYAGGHFRRIGGRRRMDLAALDAGTGRATSWKAHVGRGVLTGVNALAVSRSRVYLGGNFPTVGGRPRDGLAAVDRATGATLRWNPRPNPGDDGVHALLLLRHTLLAAGAFWSMGGGPRSDLAGLDARTGALTRWKADVHGPGHFDEVLAMATDGRRLYVGGTFTRIAGKRRRKLAALDLRTGAASPWNPRVDGGEVNALAIDGPTLYVGGDFGGVGGEHRHDLEGVSLRTGAATAWHPRVAGGDETINALAASGGLLYVGGSFSRLDGARRGSLGAFDLGSGELAAWHPRSCGDVFAIAASPTGVFAGGGFDYLFHPRCTSIVKLDPRSGAAMRWRTRLRYHPCSPDDDDPYCGEAPYVDSLAISRSRLYVGGFFTSIGGRHRRYLAALDTRTAAVGAWHPRADRQVLALAVDGSTVYAGGMFRTIGRLPRGGFAIFSAPARGTP